MRLRTPTPHWIKQNMPCLENSSGGHGLPGNEEFRQTLSQLLAAYPTPCSRADRRQKSRRVAISLSPKLTTQFSMELYDHLADMPLTALSLQRQTQTPTVLGEDEWPSVPHPDVLQCHRTTASKLAIGSLPLSQREAVHQCTASVLQKLVSWDGRLALSMANSS